MASIAWERWAPPEARLISRSNILLLSLWVCACSETGVQLIINIDAVAPRDVDALCVAVAGQGKVLFSERYELTEERLGRRQTLTVVPGDANGERFELLLTGERRRAPISFRRDVVAFSSGAVTSHEVSVPGCDPAATVSLAFGGAQTLTTGGGAMLAGVPIPGFPGQLVVPGESTELGGSGGGRIVYSTARDQAERIDDGYPTIGDFTVGGVLALDIDGSGDDRRVCTADLMLLTSKGPKLWTGDADGRFQPAADVAGLGPADIGGAAAGDFDGDGLVDVAIVYQAGLKLLVNDGAGSFAVAGAAALPSGLTNVTSVAAGSLAGVARMDLVVGRGADQPDLLLLNEGGGTFAKAPGTSFTPPAKTTTAVTVARVSDDALDDIIVGYNDDLSIYFQRGDGSFALAADLLASNVPRTDVRQILAADLDRDCDTDLVLARSSPGKSVVLRNDDGTRLEQIAELPGAGQGALIDLNGDGAVDVALGGNPAGTFWSPQTR